jgi:hypothetical protein
MQCIRDVFPSAQITPVCVDKYPIRVLIDAKLVPSGSIRVWEGDQRNLFRKYASKRKQSQNEILQNLQMLKEDLE